MKVHCPYYRYHRSCSDFTIQCSKGHIRQYYLKITTMRVRWLHPLNLNISWHNKGHREIESLPSVKEKRSVTFWHTSATLTFLHPRFLGTYIPCRRCTEDFEVRREHEGDVRNLRRTDLSIKKSMLHYRLASYRHEQIKRGPIIFRCSIYKFPNINYLTNTQVYELWWSAIVTFLLAHP